MIQITKRTGVLKRINAAWRILISSDFVLYAKFSNNWNKAATNSEFSIQATNPNELLKDTNEVFQTIHEHREMELFCETMKKQMKAK